MSDKSSEWGSSVSLWSSSDGEELDIISDTLDSDLESESGSGSGSGSGDEQYRDVDEFSETEPLEDEEYPDVDKFLKEISEDSKRNAQIIEQLKKNMLKIFGK